MARVGPGRSPPDAPGPYAAPISGEGATPSATAGRRLLRPVVAAWPILRFVIGLALAALALWALAGRQDELQSLSTVWGHLAWWWLPAAVAVEASSYVSFAGLQHRLLAAGGVRPPFGTLLGVTVAAQSINNSLPAGGAFSAIYGFRWYRRFGADDALAGWALLSTLIAAALSLALVAAAGVALATEEGASLDLITVVIGVLAVAVVAAVLVFYERPLVFLARVTIVAVKAVVRRPRGDAKHLTEAVIGFLTVVRLHWRQFLVVMTCAAGNWLLDCGCFALCFKAVGVGVPWKGLLLAYGAGQLAANLPVTPGGLGAVEGSITLALVAFGGQEASTVAAVLLYRLLSFWGELPVGWGLAGYLALRVRRGDFPRLSPADLVEQEGPGEASVVGLSTPTAAAVVAGGEPSKRASGAGER